MRRTAVAAFNPRRYQFCQREPGADRRQLREDPDFQPIAAALAELGDNELHALIATVNGVPQVTPGLLAWLEHAVDWELRRRAGMHFAPQPPEAAIDPSEDAASLAAALMLREQFALDAPAVAALFEAIVGTFADTTTKH